MKDLNKKDLKELILNNSLDRYTISMKILGLTRKKEKIKKEIKKIEINTYNVVSKEINSSGDLIFNSEKKREFQTQKRLNENLAFKELSDNYDFLNYEIEKEKIELEHLKNMFESISLLLKYIYGDDKN